MMHDSSLLMIHFTKNYIILNVIFGSQMFFTLVRIIKIGSASQLCHGQLYSDWSLSIIQVPDW